MMRNEQILAKFSRFTAYEEGETIIHEDDDDTHVYFILSGTVKVTSYSAKGREIWHSQLDAGTFIGEMAALTGSPRSVNVTAVRSTKLAVMTKFELFDLIRHDPEIGIWLLQELAKRLEERTDRLTEFVGQSMSERIRAELLRLAEDCPHSNEDQLVIRPLPNFSAIARRLNTDRENVSREVSSLARRGAIHKEKDGLRILSGEMLSYTDYSRS